MSGGKDIKFQITTVTEYFDKCNQDQLNIDHYCIAYDELYNFFCLLGSVFGFIASDVREKIDILRAKRTDDSTERDQFEQVEKMMIHEMEVNKSSGSSLLASRTLLRLHRALRFTMVFLKKLAHMGDHDKVSTVASSSYSETLAKYHPWLVRKGAHLAMYALPTRKDLLKKVVSDDIDDNEAVQKLLDDCVNAIDLVYNAIEALYTKYDLHELP